MKISAVIIAGNEEAQIADAIRSVAWADEVIVLDSESTDRTREIAGELGAKVIVRAWPGFSQQKQFAAEAASHDWIFSLDADERVSDALRAEIEAIRDAGGDEGVSGYRIPRLSLYLGRPIRHSGWYPDWQLRLFDRRHGRWSAALVHESVKLAAPGKAGRLKGDILHYTVDSVLDHHRMIGERYAPLAARQMVMDGKTTSLLKIAAAAPLAFFSTYILKLGFFDGLPGFFIAKFAAHHAFLKQACLWELQNRTESKRA
ncbi:MAG TPA: glycosyltransferase family 2 protein [Pyrinomonadaceae bacterium]|nr:glycosyltransferase family 2 protein [Pyrinomonadaceae bacterium]